ncbi:MAG: flavodoxin I [Salibacteraceae bacterium]|jgi:flavodoxin long chain
MKNIGLFYGSDTGNTEVIAGLIQNKIGGDQVDLFDVYDCAPSDMLKYDHIIIGLSTWHDGQLVSAFDEIEDELKSLDFTGKKVSLFGLGDQFGYADYYIDGVGIVGEIIKANGGELVVEWPTDEYDYESSKADLGNGFFMGLALDEDNQDNFTNTRLDEWIPQVLKAFNRV